MDDVELSRLLGRVTSALDCAKDTENDLFRMQTTLMSVLKKYGDPEYSLINEPEEDIVDAHESVTRVIEDTDESLISSENEVDQPRLIGHQDKTARLDDSDDDVDADGGSWRPNSLEVYKKRTTKAEEQANPFKKYPGLLHKFAPQNRTTDASSARETHAEVSDESTDESYQTPSSSHCDLLSADSNPPAALFEEQNAVQIETDPRPTVSDCDTPETPVNTGDVELSEVISQASKLMIDAMNIEQRPVPPLAFPNASTPIRHNSPPNPTERFLSDDFEPFTLISPHPSTSASNTSARQDLNPGSYNRAVSSPVRTQTTPVDTPYRGYETLPTNLEPGCPLCGLVFTQDHDLSYRNFHANSCLDTLG